MPFIFKYFVRGISFIPDRHATRYQTNTVIEYKLKNELNLIVGSIAVQNHPLYRLHPNTHLVRQIKLQILFQINIQLHILALHHFLVRPLHPRRAARIESTKRSQSPIRHVLRRQRNPRQRHSLHRARRRSLLPPPSR